MTMTTLGAATMTTPGVNTVNAIDPDLMKQVNRRFITGVTVVTVDDDGTPRGLAASSFTSISVDPATVLVCVQHTSSTHDSLFRSEHLAINILSTDQLEVVRRFASKSDDKFAGLDWIAGPHGSPLLQNSSARIEVQIRERLRASTHSVFIGRVVHAETTNLPPMVYQQGGKFYDGDQLVQLT
ncbi:NADH-FMN oxidoreductase RutF, flavin reductase (DIM6/NTAB) family [Quadrisphaera granulorum]|uniref:Flavin reductase (DIM6/NTAB) family NADH-FMN oxidoreductase RutF n=1 Tax=Quadrisphaera granulorum TaxID=317664 RepID=A0A316AAA4_9ACTN|nr:flavin reductase family protein [Quadrisphaera granulorum]PWJ54329.1 flavin reductase (DIM6/NTAB) family NADH-FMN oxidoreductase RutF [Quadrisphaera granulorum]SZE96101.1 NADH-FMN oxidoreductase RutF, flavin reductase (DIM6/NTAB) family [Quadrisphaera granulorum]